MVLIVLVDALLLLPPPSAATHAAILTLTAHCAVGVTVRWYTVVLIAVTVDSVQFEHVTSDHVNPITAVSNVPVTKKLAPVKYAHSVPVVNVTDGLILSNVVLIVFDALLLLPATSTAHHAAILILTAHCAVGVTVR